MTIKKIIAILISFFFLSLTTVSGKTITASWKDFQDYNEQKKEIGKKLKKLVNKKITIAGYMIPLDHSKKLVKEFLLVPYVPSCAHVPPPPENMIISVTTSGKKGIEPKYEPIKVSGTLKYQKPREKKDMWDLVGAFTLKATEVKDAPRQ